MAYDIYGNTLKRGYCEVHPNVYEEYPCTLCNQDRINYAEQERQEYEEKERQHHEEMQRLQYEEQQKCETK